MTSIEKQSKQRMVVLEGTLDMLNLRTLLYGPAHERQIGKHIQPTTNDFLQCSMARSTRRCTGCPLSTDML